MLSNSALNEARAILKMKGPSVPGILLALALLLECQGKEVTIPDPALSRAISRTLGIEEAALSAQHLLSLEELRAEGEGIKNLEGLEHAENLTVLSLRNNAVKTFYARAASLEFVDLSNNPLTNVAFAPSVTNLNVLRLESTQLQKFAVPEQLKSLVTLNLNVAFLREFSLPAGFSNLEFLNLDGNQLTSLVLPAGLTTLRSLSIGSALETLKLPGGLTNLEILTLSGGTRLKSLSLPDDLKNLRSLGLMYTGLTNVSFLRSLSSLTNLLLAGNLELGELILPDEITNLVSLTAGGNDLRSATVPGSLTRLGSLNLEYNRLATLVLSSSLTNLTELHLSGNQLAEFSFLEGLRNLNTLGLRDNELSECVFPSSLENLSVLYLNGNHLTNLDFVRALPALTTLDLADNSFSNLSFPEHVLTLTNLTISGNSLADYDFLAKLSNLATIGLDPGQLLSLPSAPALAHPSTIVLDARGYTGLDLPSWMMEAHIPETLDLRYFSELENLNFLNGTPNLKNLLLRTPVLHELILPPGAVNLSSIEFPDASIFPSGGVQLERVVLSEEQESRLTATIAEFRSQGASVYVYPREPHLAVTRQHDGTVSLTLSGPPGAYGLEHSVDLSLWTENMLVTNRLGVLEVGSVPVGARKFFRVKQ